MCGRHTGTTTPNPSSGTRPRKTSSRRSGEAAPRLPTTPNPRHTTSEMRNQEHASCPRSAGGPGRLPLRIGSSPPAISCSWVKATQPIRTGGCRRRGNALPSKEGVFRTAGAEPLNRGAAGSACLHHAQVSTSFSHKVAQNPPRVDAKSQQRQALQMPAPQGRWPVTWDLNDQSVSTRVHISRRDAYSRARSIG